MNYVDLIIIAVGLSMDAFAVAICKGFSMKNFKCKEGIKISFAFGLFQGLMPIIGYFIGSNFGNFIKNIDNYIVCFILCLIGIKMIKEGFDNSEDEKEEFSLRVKVLFTLAIATSIDALGVGIFLAFYKINIFISGLIIGIITFFLSFIGVKIGGVTGEKYKSKADIFGGVILILMGIRALIQQ